MPKKLSAALAAAFGGIIFLTASLLPHFHQDENEKFETYTYDLFRREVSSNTITLHYTLENPTSYDITDIPVSYGAVSTDADEACAAAENALAALQTHKRSKLSEENRLTYDVLESYLAASLEMGDYLLYDEPLSPLTGIQAQLPILLSEYAFHDAADIDIYLELLARTPEYFDSVIEFEQARSKAGLFMSAVSVDAIIEECTAFIQMGENNYLCSSFEDRLQELALPEAETTIYIEANQNAVETFIYPAYQNLITALNELRDTGENSGGLCHFPDGKKYYELLAAANTGSSRTIPEMQELALSQMQEDMLAMQKILQPAITEDSALAVDVFTSDVFSTQGEGLEASDPAAILTELEARLPGTFPTSPDVDVEIKYVQEDMEEYVSPAFYMIPALDSTESQVIYINQSHMPDDLSLFTTLAHEGYPGHLYQTVYYSSTDPDPVRALLTFGGYTEGWATYCEMISYYYAPVSKQEATLMQRNSSIILGLYALADMGIHYDGWSLVDTLAFFRSYGIYDTAVIEDIYRLIVGDPGNYLKYYIGYVEFLELKKEAIESWGDAFTQELFHKTVLDVGPAPFDIVGAQVK